MSQPNPVIWFEIPVADIARAKAFYSAVFGTEFTDMEMGQGKMAMFPMGMDVVGAGGCLMQEASYKPSHEGTVVYFNVASIDETEPKISPAGGKVLVPKMSIGEHGFVTHFEDTEGNRVALHQAPEQG